MFFKDHEKCIYRPPDLDPNHPGYDPLAVARNLDVATAGRLAEFIEVWKGPAVDLGDISPTGKQEGRVQAAMAEQALVEAARKVFGLPDFPSTTDGNALEWLCHYLGYMEGKELRPGRTPSSPGPSDQSSPESLPTTNLLDSTHC